MMQKMSKIREFEKEIEEMQDMMHDDANINEAKKRRLEGRIDNLKDKIRILNNDDKGN
jgi:polyhydroxyalkanoate synthesis regulator phasin